MSKLIIQPNTIENSLIPITITDQVNKYLEEVHALKSASTLVSYRNNLNTFVRWWNNQTNMSTVKEQLAQYRKYVDEKYSKSNSKNMLLVVVRNFYRFLYENDYIDHNPTAKLKNFKTSNEHSKSALNKYQLHDLFKHLREKKTKVGIRNRALIVLALQNGLRTNELANIKLEDFNQRGEDQIIFLLRKGYTGKDCYTILNPTTHAFLLEFIGDRKEGYLFQSSHGGGGKLRPDVLGRIVKVILKEIGIDDKSISCHSLRHSYAITAFKAGADIHAIKTSLNHKSLATTEIYLNSLDRHSTSAEKAVQFAY